MDVFLYVTEIKSWAHCKKQNSSTYSFNGYSGNKWILGKNTYCMQRWRRQENDILRLHLDCNNHTVSITNFRSGETDKIDILPSSKLFAYFAIAYLATIDNGDSLALVLWVLASITDVRSRETDILTNLPQTELFAYFAIYNKDGLLSLAPWICTLLENRMLASTFRKYKLLLASYSHKILELTKWPRK